LVMGNAPVTDQVLQISQERCWGFKNRKESPNICKKKLKNIRKKESENAEIRNL
jgi:hypothetical protein